MPLSNDRFDLAFKNKTFASEKVPLSKPSLDLAFEARCLSSVKTPPPNHGKNFTTLYFIVFTLYFNVCYIKNVL